MWRLSGPGHRKKRAFCQGESRCFNRITGLVEEMHDTGPALPMASCVDGLEGDARRGKTGERSLLGEFVRRKRVRSEATLRGRLEERRAEALLSDFRTAAYPWLRLFLWSYRLRRIRPRPRRSQSRDTFS